MARIMMFSRRYWRTRIVFCCGAILVGIAASYFAIAVDAAQKIFNLYILPHPYLPFIICPLVFAISAALTIRYVPAARCSGIPQAIAARTLRDPVSRHKLIGPKVAIAKILLTFLGIVGGASIGREGPTVQVGAAIMLLCATYGKLKAQRGVVLAGAAAGVAAAFNTPLAGIVFAIEEMSRSFERRNSSIV